jgi:hypothetical protein
MSTQYAVASLVVFFSGYAVACVLRQLRRPPCKSYFSFVREKDSLENTVRKAVRYLSSCGAMPRWIEVSEGAYELLAPDGVQTARVFTIAGARVVLDTALAEGEIIFREELNADAIGRLLW